VTGGLIQMICSVRKDRQEQFPGQLGSDSTWDVLLQLYASHIGQYRLNISRLTARTGAPGTTVLRALSVLSEAGLLTRSADPVDRRRVFVALSSTGLAAMNRYFLKTGARAVFL
jgi:DNA-binding MarR family transcriptional regulator